MYSGQWNETSTEQGFRGLIALANAKEGQPYRLYDFSGQKLVPAAATTWAENCLVSFKTIPGRATVVVKQGENEISYASGHDGYYDLPAGDYTYTVSKNGYTTKNGTFTVTAEQVASHEKQIISVSLVAASSSGNGASKEITVTVKVMVPPNDTDKLYTYKHDAKAYTNLATANSTVKVSSGTSVRDAMIQVLDNNKISYYEKSDGYFPTIGGWEEMGRGGNSGWMYMVGSSMPGIAAQDYQLTTSTTVTWFYTDDYTDDYGSESWSSGSTGTTTANIVTKTKANSDGTVKIAVTQNGKELSKVDGGVKVALDTKSGTGSMAVLVDKNGKETPLPKSVVENGKLYVLVPGSCTVKIVDNSRSFADVKDTDWYASAVDFAAGHGLYDGTGADAFSPKVSMSRAMLATVLYRLEGTPIAAGDALTQFADGSTVTDWAKDSMSWAVTQKILAGTDGGALAGDENITREQLAVMLARYAKACGLDTKSSGAASLTGQSVSVWAVDAMAWAVENGLLKGDETGALHPQNAASRAEVAIILQRFVAVLVK